MTNVKGMAGRWVSYYLVSLVANWQSRPLWSVFPAPFPSAPLHPESPVPSLARPEADSRLMAGRPAGHVADAVLPPHCSTVRHLNLQTWWIISSSIKNLSVCERLWHVLSLLFPLKLSHNAFLFIWLFFLSFFTVSMFSLTLFFFFTFDFFGEFDPVRVCEGSRLLVYVVDVQHFTHELDDGLGLVEGSGRHCKIKQGQMSMNLHMICVICYTNSRRCIRVARYNYIVYLLNVWKGKLKCFTISVWHCRLIAYVT